MLLRLGIDSISSDESDHENGVPMFHITIVPWRNPALTPWLRALDAIHRMARFGPIMHNTRGSPPRERFDSGLVSRNNRRAPRGLPINAYDPEWLARLPSWHRQDLGAIPPYPFEHSAAVLR